MYLGRLSVTISLIFFWPIIVFPSRIYTCKLYNCPLFTFDCRTWENIQEKCYFFNSTDKKVSHQLCLIFYKVLLIISFVDLPLFPFPVLYSPLPSPLLSPDPSLSAPSGSLYRLLLELLELLFDKFKAVAQAHSVVLAHLQQIAVQCPAGAHEEGFKLYEQADVSAKIQTVLQVRHERH